MNTKKALIVIMILLILMNAALSAYLIIINAGNRENSDALIYTESILKQRNIEIKGRIPDEVPEPSSVILTDMLYSDDVFDNLISKTGGSYSIDERGRLLFANTPEERIVIGDMNRTAVEMISREFIESIGLYQDEFILDYVIETATDEYDVRYIRKDSLGIYYYDSYIEMSVTENGVVSARVYVRDVKERISKKGKSLPIYTVLLANIVSESKAKVITGINFGYHLKNQFENEAVMSFRISFEDGSERFFDVVSGDEITLETEVLEFNNIIFECRLPEPFNKYGEIVYGESMISPFDVGSLESFFEGQIGIDDNNIITFIRTSYSDITKYEMTDEIISEIASEFIAGLNLDPTMFYQDSKILNEDGSYNLSYIYRDLEKELHFDNYINLHIYDLGVILATIRLNNYTIDRIFEESINIGYALLNNLDLTNGRVYTVKEVDSGYKRSSVDSSYAVACWRVIFEDGSERFFSVKTGQELIWDN